MAKKPRDWTDAARKYAGKNSGPNVGPNTDQVHGVNVTRPYVRTPNGRDFDQMGWNTRKTGKD